MLRDKARDAGFSNLNMPTEYGGMDLSMVSLVALEEESGKVTNGLGYMVADRGPRELLELAAREALILVLTQVALRRGIDLSVNMLGRWAVWPTMSALALALVWDSWVPEVLLYIGLAMTLAATAVYLQDGLRAIRQGSTST